ncbi:hypothetical protein [Dyella choica]|uniref:NTF2 fold domain-containing protein n=1 Tax=Dyella choica TaxID=1927959 RepID=A0A432M7N1_9GAMM|nr:hypothetical protein [Dyella choica]RUL77501.1 hypothetical protein EKH80_06310 [Dyella choica]
MKTPSAKMMYVSMALFTSLFLFANCEAREKTWWSPPPEGVIRDKVAAISIARAIYFSMNPSLEKSSEKVWQDGMNAERHGDIWKVQQKALPAGSLGGGLEIDLDAKDGRVVQIIFTQ